MLASVVQQLVGGLEARCAATTLEVNDASGSETNNGGSQRSEGRVGVYSQKEGGNATNVGASHGCAADNSGSGIAIGPCTQNVTSRGGKVSAKTIVGEVRTDIDFAFGVGANVRGLNGHNVLCAGRGVLASVVVIVTGGNRHVQSTETSDADGVVKSLGESTSERHVGNSGLLLVCS
jgi:hypothetical protein